MAFTSSQSMNRSRGILQELRNASQVGIGRQRAPAKSIWFITLT
ncbi:MAG: hypothetical protein BWY93_00560 [Euryarchaeota archaeon ADurb.BinA087]|nr:MAG: hypothetical protein BWY93_00560 [Euryarchaeota archaeon ADurb.BinA087]